MMGNNLVKRALNNTLSGLSVSQGDARELLVQAKGGKKVKRKLSVAMVLLIALVAMSITVFAVVLLWEQQYVPMKTIEKELGNYNNWPINKKQILVRALIDSGNVTESDETTKLFNNSTDDATKHAIANQIILTLTGQTDLKEVSIDGITYAIMGFEDTWTPEQRVWWQQVTHLIYGDLGNPDIRIIPTPDVISEEEAIFIAKTAILEAWGYSKVTLDKSLPVANLYVTKQRPDYRRWEVLLKMLKDGSANEIGLTHVVVVDEHGQVVDDPDMGIVNPKDSFEKMKSIPGRPTTPLFQAIDALSLRANESPFRVWPLELKAEYSKVVAPQVRAIVKTGDLTALINGNGPDLNVIASSTFTYGTPREKDILQGEALDIAIRTIVHTYSLDNKIIALYDDISVFFDITDPDVPLWKFLFTANIGSELFLTRYKVEMNSRTGAVTKTEVIEFRKALERDLEYVLRFY
ncbi:MAG: hypothetical protein GX768_07910 [Chloroflexi bacterium]|nr:hypothetical protein [Chloroflexota bacterium]